MEQVIAHIDMDCFFCSCEMKKNPDYKGKPVIVGSTGDRGVVSAANYEARNFGVFSATPITKARTLCPDGIFLPVDMKFYKKESIKIMNIFSQFTEKTQQVSVDEAYLDLTEFSQKFNSIEKMAEYIQEKVSMITNLTCSIGVAESRIVAKIASDYKKPAGITIVRDPKKFLANMPIKKFPGIGKVSYKHYQKKGIFLIKDLTKLNRFKVISLFGMQGVKYQDIALGKDKSGLKFKEKVKSISKEHTFKVDCNENAKIKDILKELSTTVGKKLDNEIFRTVSIKIRDHDFKTITRDKTLINYSNSTQDIIDFSERLFEENYNGQKLRLIGVKITNLKKIKLKQMILRDFI